MKRRWVRRRRLVWAAVLLGLVVIVAVLSVVDAGLRSYDQLVSATRDRRSKPKKRPSRRPAANPAAYQLAAGRVAR